MKARILGKPRASIFQGKEVWHGNAQFSDGKTFAFRWVKLSATALAMTTYVVGGGKRAHNRDFSASAERDKALLEALYEYQNYWARIDGISP